MRLDEVTAEIRPRGDWEAVDLGFAMVRRDFWRCFAVWWLALALPTLVAGILLWNYPFLVLVLFWWWKPAGSRMVLFEISRRLFGERPPWRAVWRELPRAWGRRFLHRFVWLRFSPWLPVTLAVEDLEGLRGAAYRQRCGQVARRGEGAIMWIYFVAEFAAAWLGLALLGLVMMFIPEGQDGAWQMALDSWDPDHPHEIPLLIQRVVVYCVMLAISLTDMFVTGTGFGIYINNRTWLEGWDVELAFKRLARRLSKVAVLIMVTMVWLAPAASRAEEAPPPSQLVREIKEHPDFKVHTVKDRVPKSKSTTKTPPSWLAGAGQMVAYFFAICTIVVLLGLLGWALWKYRHALKIRGAEFGGDDQVKPAARVVMGMEVSAVSLPDDVPTAAWALWQQGHHQESLALLYRGSISRVIDLARVEIEESDTEGECLRRVEGAGPAAHPEYFRGITGVWSRLAYAGIQPAETEVRLLCDQWPFGGRRSA